jgi:ParB family chromosome partitioning protein
MATAVKTDSVSAPAPSGVRGIDIIVPLNKLKKSPANARRVPHGEAAIAALAASIAVKGMLQPPVVAPEIDGEGRETGFYLVTAGEGRRLALLELVKAKAIKKTEAIRCSLDTLNDPHEVSLDENVTRTPMHPADQYEAFKRLAEEKGLGAEEIGARFGVSAHVVRQRLRLGAVSPRLLDIYRAGDLTLDQLMAFAITEDHGLQEEVHERLSWNRDPATIRRDLTQTNVPGSDRRAVFVGPEAYQEAGGVLIRDLFSDDRGGYFADAGLLDRLVAEGLNEIALEVRKAEGWKWIDVSVDFPHGHGFRRVWPESVPLSPEDALRLTEAGNEFDDLIADYGEDDELPEDVAAKLDALDAEVAAITAKRSAFRDDDVARGGVVICLGHDGTPSITRGFIRPEDEALGGDPVAGGGDAATYRTGSGVAVGDDGGSDGDAGRGAEGGDAVRPLSDALIADLSAWRTMALRVELGDRPDLALACVVHALATSVFYSHSGPASLLDLKLVSARAGDHGERLAESTVVAALESRHGSWGERLPGDIVDLWPFIVALDQAAQLDLLAHVASLSANALVLRFDRRPAALRHADSVAEALALDMTRHWTPTIASYFGRVTKPQIVAAVREGIGDAAAEGLAGARKDAMASAAEGLVAGTGWLPVQLRTAKTADAVEAGPSSGGASGDSADGEGGNAQASGPKPGAAVGDTPAGGGDSEAVTKDGGDVGAVGGTEGLSSVPFAEAAE